MSEERTVGERTAGGMTARELTRAQKVQHTLMLLVTAMVWGAAFVAQSVGAEYVGPFTYLAARSWLAAAALVPVIAFADRRAVRVYGMTFAPKTAGQRRDLLLGSLMCGTLLCTASAAQQAGIAYTTTAKSGFITALYCVLVPIELSALGKKQDRRIWLCVILAVAGLYLLCMHGGEKLALGDSLTLLCALLFSFQILTVSHFVQRVDGVRLAQGQFIATALISTVCALLFEPFRGSSLMAALPSILYAGLISSAVGYTLQIVAQRGLDPTVASLAMCLESVFSALAGWLLLGQTMTGQEMAGAGMMFAAIVLAQLFG